MHWPGEKPIIMYVYVQMYTDPLVGMLIDNCTVLPVGESARDHLWYMVYFFYLRRMYIAAPMTVDKQRFVTMLEGVGDSSEFICRILQWRL